jgi:(2Fe-2S) ferredoxin
VNGERRLTVVVCSGPVCRDQRGSAELRKHLDDTIAVRALGDRVQVVDEVCLGHCLRGPNVLVVEESQRTVLYNRMTVADLDRATDEALGKVKPAIHLMGDSRDALWADLIGADRAKAAAAIRTFLAFAPDQVEYIGRRLPKSTPEIRDKIRGLIEDLGSPVFRTRDAASVGLLALGSPAMPAVRAAAGSTNPEVKERARKILKDYQTVGGDGVTASRVVRVVERAGSEAAVKLLTAFVDGEYGEDVVGPAKTALARKQ